MRTEPTGSGRGGPRIGSVPSGQGAAERKHDVGVAVVCTAVAVFAGGAAEFAHGHDHDVFHAVAHVLPERRQRPAQRGRADVTMDVACKGAGGSRLYAAKEAMRSMLLASGDKVPADLRLVATRDLQIAEAALTGESTAVEKNADLQLAAETSLADRANMAYASTLVTYGQGRGVVTSTGDHTEIGRISEMISAAQSLETPLTRKIKAFGHKLLILMQMGLVCPALVTEW